MRRRKLLCGTAAAIAVLLVASACGSGGGNTGDSAGAGLTKITVGTLPATDVAAIYIGASKGFFKDEGLDVKLQMAQSGAAVVPAVLSRQFDFGFSSIGSILVASDKGLGLRLAAPGSFSSGKPGHDVAAVVVSPKSGINDLIGLAGANVAANSIDNILSVTTSELVSKAGADPKKIKWVEIPWANQAAALAQGQIAAAVLVEPFLTQALAQGNKAIAWNWAETDPNFLIAGYFTTSQFAKEKPAVVSSFAKAMTKSLAYAQAHPDEVRTETGRFLEIPAETLKAMNLPRFDGQMTAQQIELQANLSRTYGLMKKPANVTELLP
jgi:NitT/TauT family transport system substrate-binding protein